MNKEKCSTPEEFCWLYAVGCLESRLYEKTLSKADYDLAVTYLEKGTTPPQNLIRQWFPKPFTLLERNGTPCTLETMQKYWRESHLSPKQDSPVYLAEIEEIKEIPGSHYFVKARILEDKVRTREEKKLVAFNLHNLNIEPGLWIIVHGSVIAEIAV